MLGLLASRSWKKFWLRSGLRKQLCPTLQGLLDSLGPALAAGGALLGSHRLWGGSWHQG